MSIRKLNANPHVSPGSWDMAECADALMQIASATEVLAKQLDQLWNLANRDIRANLDVNLAGAFDHIHLQLARKIEAHAAALQEQADSEAA
jgi:hypothetical protein